MSPLPRAFAPWFTAWDPGAAARRERAEPGSNNLGRGRRAPGLVDVPHIGRPGTRLGLQCPRPGYNRTMRELDRVQQGLRNNGRAPVDRAISAGASKSAAERLWQM